MPQPPRRRMRLLWPYGPHCVPWHHFASPYGPPFGYGGDCGWGRPPAEDEKAYVDEYIEMLKEELAAAEEYRKDQEAPE